MCTVNKVELLLSNVLLVYVVRNSLDVLCFCVAFLYISVAVSLKYFQFSVAMLRFSNVSCRNMGVLCHFSRYSSL